VVVGPVASLFQEARRKTVRVGLVVGELRVDVVEDLQKPILDHAIILAIGCSYSHIPLNNHGIHQ
jgi:hypothetical protein